MSDEILNVLGFAQKAGKLISGGNSLEAALKKGRVKLLILAENASQNTREKFIRYSKQLNIPLITFGNSFELGSAIGKSPRMIIGITDQQFTSIFLQKAQV